MSDLWYYAQDDKSVGPLTLSELKTILAGASEAKNILVWRDGFSGWTRAANVPELAPHTIKPPPLLHSPPALQHVPSVPVGEGQSSNSSGSKIIRRIASGILIAIVVAGVRFLSHSGGAPSSPDPSSIISGKMRDSFVSAGMSTCLKKQENDPDTKALSLSKEILEEYCSCYMNALADTMTYGELSSAPTDGSIPAAFQKRIDAADTTCTDKMRRSLLGGSRTK